jgi:Ca2+-binding RTX toxin-like protein
MGIRIDEGSFIFDEQDINFSGFLNISEPDDSAFIQFTRFGSATGILNIPYTISGTATNGVDYELLSGILTFDANSASANLPIIIRDDAWSELSETIILNFPGGITFNMEIVDDDPVIPNNPVITLAVTPASVTEDGAANLVYTFTRTGATTSALTVNYGVDGTAGLTSDYTQTGAASFTNTAGTVTFAVGATTAKVTIDPKADTTVEANETVRLTLKSGTGYTVGTAAAVIGTITNDDIAVVVKPTITLAVAPATVTEDGANNLVYTFTRTGATTSALTVNYGVDGTAGLTSDYTQTGAASFTNIAGTVTFAVGATTAKVIIDPKADSTVEADETVRLTLKSGTDYTVGTTAAVIGTINNDDTAVVVPNITLAVTPTSVTEDGAANLVYTFTRTGATTSALTVNYGVDGTAGLTSDYTQTGAASFTNTAGTVTFAVGATTAKVTIDPKADTTVEANETVRLTLASGTGYTVGTTGAVIGTINNDDTAVVDPTQTIAGKTQSQLGDEWWQWDATIPQDDNPIRDRTGDFAAINQTGAVYFLAGEGNGIANRINVIVPVGKYLFFPTNTFASLGNNLPEFGGDTRFANPGNPGGIGDIENSTQQFNNPVNFNLTIDGTSVLQLSDAKKYIQSSQNLTDGFSFITPENSSIFPGAVPDGTTWGKNYQTGYYIGLKPLDPGKHTIHFTTNVAGNNQDINYEIEVKSFNEIGGNNSNNTINGTASNDDIDAFGGNDTVNGLGGDDTIDTGAGDDIVSGGDGNDIVYGGAGKDTLNGDAGDDVLAGGLADDTINGGLGNDRLYGGSGKDTIKGDGGDDKIFGGLGNDTIDGGAGNDIIDAVAYSPLVLPVISGSPVGGEIDILKGGAGKDLFGLGMAGGAGVTGAKYYLGNGNSDYALIQDFTLGTDGDKIQLYSETLNPSDYKLESAPAGAPSGVGIFAKTSTSWDLVGIIQGVPLSSLSLTNSSQFTFVDEPQPRISIADFTIVEGINGNPSQSLITVSLSKASAQAVSVNYATSNGTAIAGTDYTATTGTLTFAAGQTSKTIAVPILNDNLNEANETFEINLSAPTNATIADDKAIVTITDTFSTNVTSTLAALVENITLTGTSTINGTANAGNNVLIGNAANNTLTGLNGNDTYRYDADLVQGIDTIVETTTGGSDTLDFTQTAAAVNINLSLSNTQTVNANLKLVIPVLSLENVFGGSGKNRITGNSLNNSLYGGNGDDRIFGAAGNDTIYGQGGNDIISGGAGNDIFAYNGALLSGAITVNGLFGLDTISDFTSNEDKISLSKSTFDKITSQVGAAMGGDFIAVDDDSLVETQSAAIVYSLNSGSLFYNQNGIAAGFGTNGGEFATLLNVPTLKAADFIVA